MKALVSGEMGRFAIQQEGAWLLCSLDGEQERAPKEVVWAIFRAALDVELLDCADARVETQRRWMFDRSLRMLTIAFETEDELLRWDALRDLESLMNSEPGRHNQIG